MHKRTLGRTGEELSVIGFGGIVCMNETPEDSERYVARAIELGINYFDVAPAYGDAEERLGPALEPYRDQVFLACKTNMRDAEKALEQLEESLGRLRTDHVDLYQFHSISSKEDAEQILGPGGAMEASIKAREEGKIRYIGFSAHCEDSSIWMLDQFDFDSVLFPFNTACWYKGNFGHRLVEKAQEKGTGLLALKSLAYRPWKEDEKRGNRGKCWYKPVETQEEIDTSVQFTLSLPVTAAVCPGYADLMEMSCKAAEDFVQLSEGELDRGVEIEGSEPIFPK